jgi:hypothetical protein
MRVLSEQDSCSFAGTYRAASILELAPRRFEQPPPVLIGFVLDHSALVELMQRARIIELRLIEFAAEATARAT